MVRFSMSDVVFKLSSAITLYCDIYNVDAEEMHAGAVVVDLTVGVVVAGVTDVVGPVLFSVEMPLVLATVLVTFVVSLAGVIVDGPV